MNLFFAPVGRVAASDCRHARPPRLPCLPPLQIGELVGKPRALAVGAVERGLQLDLLGVEVLGGRIGVPVDLNDGSAQIGFGTKCDLKLPP